jgi:hypothetical protein
MDTRRCSVQTDNSAQLVPTRSASIETRKDLLHKGVCQTVEQTLPDSPDACEARLPETLSSRDKANDDIRRIAALPPLPQQHRDCKTSKHLLQNTVGCSQEIAREVHRISSLMV